jgi:hypothetical protein
MTIECPDCGTENPEGGKFCVECGQSLPGKEERDGSSNRFKTVVAILIAVVSIAGAALAYRITIASGIAADADVAGIVSSVNLHQARVASEAELYRDLKAYLQVRIHDQLSHDLIAIRNLYPDEDPTRERLWDDGWTETHVAEAYLDQIDLLPEYLRADGSFDEEAALDIKVAGRSLTADFNREGHFAEADRLRTKVQLLMGVALILTGSLLFYTLAEVITRPIKYLFVALGTGIFFLAFLAALAIELVMS